MKVEEYPRNILRAQFKNLSLPWIWYLHWLTRLFMPSPRAPFYGFSCMYHIKRRKQNVREIQANIILFIKLPISPTIFNSIITLSYSLSSWCNNLLTFHVPCYGVDPSRHIRVFIHLRKPQHTTVLHTQEEFNKLYEFVNYGTEVGIALAWGQGSLDETG